MPLCLKPKLKTIGNSIFRVGMQPEIELLLCCIRTHVESKTAERINALLQYPIHWDYLIQVASYHRVLPLLYQNLEGVAHSVVPATVLNQLRKRFYANSLYNSILTQELLRLVNLFAAHEIPVIPFKGPVLAAVAYRDLNLRQFVDLDIFIRKQDIPKASQLLIAEGYQLGTKQSWQQQFWHQQGFTVDLHYELTPLSYFPFAPGSFECLWQRTQSISLMGQTVVSFASDDLLIILALQIARSGFEGKELLIQICDLAELLYMNPNVDYQRLIQRAKSLSIERPLFIGFLLVENLLNIQLPEILQQTIQQRMKTDPVPTLYHAWMRQRILSIPKSDRSLLMQEFIKYLMTAYSAIKMPYPIDLIWYFLRFIVSVGFIGTEVDRKFLPLPAVLSPLYCLIRPIRLISQYGMKQFRY